MPVNKQFRMFSIEMISFYQKKKKENELNEWIQNESEMYTPAPGKHIISMDLFFFDTITLD